MAETITETANTFHLQQLVNSQADNPFPVKCVAVETPDTVDDADTISITLATYGLTTVWDVWAFTHSTTDDIVITETTEMVTNVVSGVLKVAVQGSTDNKKRVILVWGV